MSFGTRAIFEPLRSLAFGSIAADYAAIGTALTHQARMMIIVNASNTDVIISFDDVNDHLFMPTASQIVLDFTSNEVDMNGLFIPKGTIVYAKYATGVATTGAVYVSVVYAYGDNQ